MLHESQCLLSITIQVCDKGSVPLYSTLPIVKRGIASVTLSQFYDRIPSVQIRSSICKHQLTAQSEKHGCYYTFELQVIS